MELSYYSCCEKAVDRVENRVGPKAQLATYLICSCKKLMATPYVKSTMT